MRSNLSIVTLADIARAEMDAHMTGSVAERFPSHVYAALDELTDAVEESGVERRDAEYAVSCWRIRRTLSIEQCIELEQTDEARATRRPRP